MVLLKWQHSKIWPFLMVDTYHFWLSFTQDYWKLSPLLISIIWPNLVTSGVAVQKIYSKIHLVSCTNTHRDITDLVNHGIVKNTKTLLSWEQNIIFLQNKKILNLCFRWHILRSYCSVVEVTFNKVTILASSFFNF